MSTYFSAIKLAWWSNAGGSVLLLPLVFVTGEHTTLLALIANGGREYKVFLYGCLVTGAVGFLLSIAGLLSIKITSPITHMFASVGLLHYFFLISLFIIIIGCSFCPANPSRRVALQ